MDVLVVNQGNVPLSAYHIDVEIPSPVAMQGSHINIRNDLKVVVYRVSQKECGDILPGDERVVMSIPYFMDHEVYYGYREIFQQDVTATLRPYGSAAVIIQKSFESLQRF